MSAALAKLLATTVAAGGKQEAVKFGMAFDAKNLAAQAWARKHAVKMIREIEEEARRAIRGLIEKGIANQVPVRNTASIIRSTIGLTERDALAVMNQHVKHLARGMEATRAVEKAERYSSKLLRSRSITIARTETMRASNRGLFYTWRQATEKGLLTGRERKTWIVADPCPICRPLAGETVSMLESFSIGGDPPAHPRCRCTMGLVI